MMSKFLEILGATILLLSLSGLAVGQTETTTVTKVTKTVQNPDGTYTIVEYPVGREILVNLSPVGLSGATGTATILRDPSGTMVKLNLTSLPSDVTSLNVYAVDPNGTVTLLGPVDVINGTGRFATTTPLSRFMLIASPEASLRAYNSNTRIFFRSSVPSGLTITPESRPLGEPVSAVTTVSSDYTVPMLGIRSFKRGGKTKLRVNFGGAMEGAHANIFIEPHKRGRATEVKMHFYDLKEAPKGQAYILWAVSPDNRFVRLGEIVNVRGRNEAEIRSETRLDDFGLILTMEDLGPTKGTIVMPGGRRVGVIEVIR
jgi:hypothetical protein